MDARRALRVAVISLVAVVGLAACSSPPSAKRVALDVVDTLDISDEAKTCMRDKIENDYGQDQLQDIAEGADAGDTADVEALAEFEADLAECTG